MRLRESPPADGKDPTLFSARHVRGRKFSHAGNGAKDIRPGQSGRLVLAASPDQSLELKVLRVIPMAASAAARNYFEVEAALDTRGQALRPGLRGVAKIDAGRHSMLWMLTHRALNWLRLAWWSLSP